MSGRRTWQRDSRVCSIAESSESIPDVILTQQDFGDLGQALLTDTARSGEWDATQAFDFSLPFSADTEALLDNLIQPHLDVGAPYRSKGSPWQWWHST